MYRGDTSAFSVVTSRADPFCESGSWGGVRGSSVKRALAEPVRLKDKPGELGSRQPGFLRGEGGGIEGVRKPSFTSGLPFCTDFPWAGDGVTVGGLGGVCLWGFFPIGGVPWAVVGVVVVVEWVALVGRGAIWCVVPVLSSPDFPCGGLRGRGTNPGFVPWGGGDFLPVARALGFPWLGRFGLEEGWSWLGLPFVTCFVCRGRLGGLAALVLTGSLVGLVASCVLVVGVELCLRLPSADGRSSWAAIVKLALVVWVSFLRRRAFPQLRAIWTALS